MHMLKCVMWEILSSLMRMLKYILGLQETYEKVLRNNPLKTIKNTQSEDKKRWWK